MYLPKISKARTSLILGFVLLVAFTTLDTAKTQEKKDQDKADSAQKGQKPGSDVDGPVIVHTDLITLTVTVTDTYGRFVSGLNKSAFTVLDEKKPQEITFFSDDDSPVSVGVIF